MTDDYINKMWDRIIEEEQVVSIEAEKGRVYVDDPSQAPDDADVQEGDQGGYFYVTDGGSSDSGGEDSEDSSDIYVPDNPSTEEIAGSAQELGEQLADNHEGEVTADTYDEVRQEAENALSGVDISPEDYEYFMQSVEDEFARRAEGEPGPL